MLLRLRVCFLRLVVQEDTATGRPVAIKRVLRDTFRAGVNLGAIKELQAMQEVRHPNLLQVSLSPFACSLMRPPDGETATQLPLYLYLLRFILPQLLDVFSHGDRVHLVMELAVTDLARIARDRTIVLSEAHVKGFMQQMLAGLAHLHGQQIMHRDLKPDNVLITADGGVKLADFGHAGRFPEPDQALFHRVVTIWYRAPELLLQAHRYGPAVDVWAAGCIMAELLLRQPLFPARFADGRDDEMQQLAAIVRLLGNPSDPWLATLGGGHAPLSGVLGVAAGPSSSAKGAAGRAAPLEPAPGAGTATEAAPTVADMVADMDARMSLRPPAGFGSVGTTSEPSGWVGPIERAEAASLSVYARSETAAHSVAARVCALRAAASVLHMPGPPSRGPVSRAGPAEEDAAPAAEGPSASATSKLASPETSWPASGVLPGFCEFESRTSQPWASIFAGSSTASPAAIDLVSRMLSLDPLKRISAADALDHSWFKLLPLPAAPDRLPMPAAVRKSIAEVAAGKSTGVASA